MARIFGNESFEATGYDETWSLGETVDPGSLLDPDYATSNHPGTPSNWGDSCLRVVVAGGDNAEVGHDFGTELGRSFVRTEFIWVTENGNAGTLMSGADAVGDGAWTVRLNESTEGVYFVRYTEKSDGAFHSHNGSNISLDTAHRIEVKWDVDHLAWEFRLDGVTEFSGTMTGSATGFQILRVGVTGTAPAQSQEILLDNIVVDDAEFPGAPSDPTPPEDIHEALIVGPHGAHTPMHLLI